ncbi:MAG: AgmX/PglI C-terminal domain-containing protein [Bradymonadales bacterium]|nr:AgmX/PglI C-terminal domain-containing protein [Bradymonadales bacterium]
MATATSSKNLRIGVIQNGTLIEERLFTSRQRVTIGKRHKNSLSVFAPSMPDSHPLFEVKHGRYHLQWTDAMTGRLSLGSAVFKLERLKEEGKAARTKTGWSIPLDEQTRGKIEIGDIFVLFQFVSPPPIRPGPQMPVALRGGPLRFLNSTVELTGPFGLALLLSVLLQVGFILYVVIEVPPPPRPVDINDLPDEIRMILAAQVEEPAPLDVDELAERERAEQAAEEEQQQVEAEEQQTEEQQAQRREERRSEETATTPELSREDRLRVARQRVRDEAFFTAMFTSNDGSGPVMEQVFNMSDRSVEHVLRRVRARGDGSLVSRSGALSTGEGEEGIPLAQAVNVDLSASTGMTQQRAQNLGQTGERERVRVRSDIRGSRERVVGEGRCDPEALNQSLRQKVRDIQRCYERVLPDHPTLEGRIVLQFTIDERGLVSDVRLVENEVGDQVGSCVEGRVRRWRFDVCEGGAVTVQKTFILSPARD